MQIGVEIVILIITDKIPDFLYINQLMFELPIIFM